jgi:hypothetical protein
LDYWEAVARVNFNDDDRAVGLAQAAVKGYERLQRATDDELLDEKIADASALLGVASLRLWEKSRRKALLEQSLASFKLAAEKRLLLEDEDAAADIMLDTATVLMLAGRDQEAKATIDRARELYELTANDDGLEKCEEAEAKLGRQRS